MNSSEQSERLDALVHEALEQMRKEAREENSKPLARLKQFGYFTLASAAVFASTGAAAAYIGGDEIQHGAMYGATFGATFIPALSAATTAAMVMLSYNIKKKEKTPSQVATKEDDSWTTEDVKEGCSDAITTAATVAFASAVYSAIASNIPVLDNIVANADSTSGIIMGAAYAAIGMVASPIVKRCHKRRAYKKAEARVIKPLARPISPEPLEKPHDSAPYS